jgi:hypothetical protein
VNCGAIDLSNRFLLMLLFAIAVLAVALDWRRARAPAAPLVPFRYS